MNFVHICEHAFLSEGGKLNLIGIFKTIRVKKFPGGIPKFNIVGELEISSQVSGDFKLRTVLITPEGKLEKNVIPPITGKLEKVKEDDKVNLNFNLEVVGYRFTKQGEYKFLFKFNESKIGEISINVVQYPATKK